MNRKITNYVIGGLGLAAIIGPVWWWALFGMSEDVGLAWVVTSLTLIVGTLIKVIAELDIGL